MHYNHTKEDNITLDRIIAARRSIRHFSADIPPREIIEEILKAGLMAPYAGASGKQLSELRRFIVIRKDTDAMRQADALVHARVKSHYKKFRLARKIVPYLRRHGADFEKKLESGAENGLPVFKTAPYYIVAAERKAMPPVQEQSLAYVMQNMWLKATALNLGFQLVSATQIMHRDREFLKLIGLPEGEFSLDGCAIGYPQQEPAPRSLPDIGGMTAWL